MKNIFLLFGFSFCITLSHAQIFLKNPIGNSGCSLHSYCDFRFETEYSEDSSLVYMSECEKEKINYGVICIKLLVPIDNLDNAEEALISYLDYLKNSFKILKSAGYGMGHRLVSDENTRGVLDYWEDSEKNNWIIKGWTNGKFIGVLYGYSTIELPERKLNIFLESFRFPDL